MNTSELPRLVPEEYRAALADAMELYEITTPKRVTAFIAQIAHESARFTRMVESLNYSPHRLLQVFPKHFLPAEAVQFAHDERRIANRVYGGRMGNGTEATGDGYRFRGRGFIMLTGRNAYRNAGKHLGEPLEDEPERAAQPNIAALIAADYWATRGCNELADADKYETITRAINGGLNGHEDRLRLMAEINNEWRTK